MTVTYDLGRTELEAYSLRQWDWQAGRRFGQEKPGLGTTIIEALAKQLDARVEVSMDPHGTTVSITHAPFTSRLPAAA